MSTPDATITSDPAAVPPTAEVVYEPDLTAPPATAAEAPAPSVTPPVPAAVPEAAPYDVQRELEESRRTVNELRSQFSPLIEERQRAVVKAANTPPVTLERLNSGEATAKELIDYIAWQQNQGLQQMRETANYEARVAASEATVRGQFTGDALGAPERGYDTLRAKYLEPAYRSNPAIRQAIATLSPDSPAIGEMYVAAFLHAKERNGGDDLKAIKAIFNALGAATTATTDLTTKITEAAARGADQITRERGPGAQRRRVDSSAIWDMSDQEFREFSRQQTGQ